MTQTSEGFLYTVWETKLYIHLRFSQGMFWIDKTLTTENIAYLNSLKKHRLTFEWQYEKYPWKGYTRKFIIPYSLMKVPIIKLI